MFTLVCEKCGSEVPLHYNKCPRCFPQAVPVGPSPVPPAYVAPAVPSYVAPPPPQNTYAPPPAVNYPPPPGQPNYYAAPQPQQYAAAPVPVPVAAPAPVAAPPTAPPMVASARTMPAWMVTGIVALIVVGLVAGAVWITRRGNAAPVEESSAATTAATPSAGSADNPLAKFIELTGFRIGENTQQKPQLRFIAVNHSGGELSDVTVRVDLKTTNGRKEDAPIASFETTLPRLDPSGSKEVTVPLETKVRAYELPDWQFLRAEFTVVSR